MRRLLLCTFAATFAFSWLCISPAATSNPIRFVNAASKAGIRFTVRNSATPQKHLIETMIAGVAVFDYNNDGKPDIYFVNGARIPDLMKSDGSFYNRLYRNDGDGSFTDVTATAGVPGIGYGMGVAIGDYDNGGLEDTFLPGVNRNVLYHNRGNRTFEDVTAKAGLDGGLAGKPWSVAAAWFDYDNDGFLDLFVVNYVAWDPAKEQFCGDRTAGIRIYCHPEYYRGLSNRLYHNNGNGTFTDVSKLSGIAGSIGKGMGVAIGDYDGDGKLDVFVGTDTQPNFLFHNEGNGRFREVGLQANVAYNEDGRPISSMGVDFRDYDNDGREDVFASALENETFPLFRNLGGGQFEDVSHEYTAEPLDAHCDRLERWPL